MPPTYPCRGCKDSGSCPVAGQMCRLAMEAWIDDQLFECPDYQPDYYHGIDGVLK